MFNYITENFKLMNIRNLTFRITNHISIEYLKLPTGMLVTEALLVIFLLPTSSVAVLEKTVWLGFLKGHLA